MARPEDRTDQQHTPQKSVRQEGDARDTSPANVSSATGGKKDSLSGPRSHSTGGRKDHTTPGEGEGPTGST